MPFEPVTSAVSEESLKTASLISYVLHLVVAVSAIIPGAQMGPALLLVALILDLIKKNEAKDTWQASHFSYRIRTLIWAAVLYLLSAPLWFLFILPGWLAWCMISVWFLYRIVRGLVCLNQQQAMDV